MEGLAYCDNGEIAKARADGISDFVPGKGSQSMGYNFFTFEDGSTFVIKYQRSVVYDESGRGSAKASSEFIKGTGRFERIKGTSTSTGKNFQRTTEEPTRAFTDMTFTYTLPSK